jgi:membrane associated rhomboid family serine protease
MSFYQGGGGFLAGMPPVVKNLLILNGLAFLLAFSLGSDQWGYILNRTLGVYYIGSPRFEPYQIVSYMFMHGNFMHIFFNMFALWMFGTSIERALGSARFLTYYFVTGIGALVLHEAVLHYEYVKLTAELTPAEIQMVKEQGQQILESGRNFTNYAQGQLNYLLNIPTVGASGAVFGILLAFGMLFPNVELIMIFLPIPIKAKYFVIFYGVAELFSAIAQRPGDNVAHYAHLGGMLFGWLLLKFWGKSSRNPYS